MDNGLLTFDDNSPLFVNKKNKPKRRPRKKKVPAKVENDIAPLETPKRKREKKEKKVPEQNY